MKKRLLIGFTLGLALLACVGWYKRFDYGLELFNDSSEIFIVMRSKAQTNSWITCNSGGTIKFNLPASGMVPVAYGGTGTNTVAGAKSALGIRTGTITTVADGTQTNVFSPAYSTAPVVIVTPNDANSRTNCLTKVSTTNFIVSCNLAGVTLQWMSIGPP